MKNSRRGQGYRMLHQHFNFARLSNIISLRGERVCVPASLDYQGGNGQEVSSGALRAMPARPGSLGVKIPLDNDTVSV